MLSKSKQSQRKQLDWLKLKNARQPYQLRLKKISKAEKFSKSKKTARLIKCKTTISITAEKFLKQKSNEYRLACIGTFYLKRLFEFLKKSRQLFKSLIAIFNCRLKQSSHIGTFYLKRLFEFLKSHANYSKGW